MKNSDTNRITILAFSLNRGGAEKVCVTICNGLAQRGYDIELWVVNYESSSLAENLSKEINVITLKKKRVRNALFSLARLLRSRHPDNLLVFHVELAVLAILLKKILFLKTRIIVRSINTLSQAYRFPKGLWEKYIAKPSFRYILKRSDKIIAQSTGMRNDLIESFSISPHKIITIHNPAVNLNGVPSVSYDNQAITNFLFAGRLSQQKGLDNLIKAFKLAHNGNPAIRLTIVGDGPERAKIENLVSELKLTGIVTFEGFQVNVAPYFLKAKATLLTSHFEGFPNVLVESISVGTPVISFNCPSGPEDIIETGVNGLLIPHLNNELFGKAIYDVSKNTYSFNKEEVIKTARKFSLSRILEKYEQVILTAEK